MAKKKISIGEVEKAFAILEQAGIQVQAVQPVQQEEVVQVPKVRKGQIFPTPSSVLAEQQQNRMVKVNLWAKHSIGSGGFTVNGPDGKQVEQAGVQSYGPGVCMVPVEYVGHLVKQDQLAKQADDNMLDKTQRSYMVVRKMSPDGHAVNASIAVSNDVFGDFGSLPDNYIYKL